MTASELTARFDVAEALAREAGALALGYFHEPGTFKATLKGAQDVASEVDGMVEALIRERLLAAFPGDGFLGEEDGVSEGAEAAPGIWVVDPIDGTANFVNHIPVWSVSIAYVVGNSIEIGLVYDPNADELFAARRGQGATVDGVAERASPATSLTAGTVGIGYSPRTSPEPVVQAIAGLLEAGGMYQRNGSGALMLAYVAAGRLLGYYEPHINAWDCLAGILLVQEAGGWTSDFLAGDGLYKGNPLTAAAPGVATALWAVVGMD